MIKITQKLKSLKQYGEFFFTMRNLLNSQIQEFNNDFHFSAVNFTRERKFLRTLSSVRSQYKKILIFSKFSLSKISQASFLARLQSVIYRIPVFTYQEIHTIMDSFPQQSNPPECCNKFNPAISLSLEDKTFKYKSNFRLKFSV